jgi:tetratricopeptide (TPR) repeat protein
MAAVYLARQMGTGRMVALKITHPHLASDRSFLERAQREVKALVGLRHENIVEVLAYGEEQGRWYIASEYADGGTVEDLLRRLGKLPAAVAACLGADMLSGLGYAHGRGIVHRDVKPGNLLLTRAGVVKVADFGIAKKAGSATLTQTGMLLGTPAYMSPEQASGHPIDARSDLFAAGIVLYETLTGRNPYHSENPTTALLNIVQGRAQALFEADPTVPPALEAVVEKLLCHDPARRYQSAAEALSDLGPMADEVRARHPDLIRRFLADPVGLKSELLAEQAGAFVQEAERLLAQGAAKYPAAALLLYRAALLCPDSARASDLLREVCAQGRISFDAPPSAKVAEMERAAEQAPEAPAPWQRLAQLHRQQRNLYKAAAAYKRYLKLRPEDGYAASQLSLLLTGEQAPPVQTAFFAGGAGTGRPKDAAPPAAATAPPEGVPLATQPLGLSPPPAAPPPPRPAVVPPRPRVRDVETISTAQVFWESYGKKLLAVAVLAGLGIFIVHKLGGTIDEGARDLESKMQQLGEALRPPGPPPPGEALRPGDPQRRYEAERLRLLDRDRARASRGLDQGMMHFRSGDFEAAAQAFRAVVRAAPQRPEASRARFLFAKSLLGAGRTTDAVPAFTEFMERHPGSSDYPEAVLRRGQAYHMLGAHARAIRDYDDLIGSHAGSSLVTEAFLSRADAAAAIGSLDAARADYQIVLSRAGKADPLHGRARAGLARLGGDAGAAPRR